MFDSGVSVSDLVAELKTEVDVAVDIPNSAYVMWLNGAEQLIYSEIVKEQAIITVSLPDSPIDLSFLPVPNGVAPIRFEDIYTVFADDVQLIRSTVTSGVIFPNTFYKNGSELGFSADEANVLRIVYFVRPLLKTVLNGDVIGLGNVNLPYEFLDVIKAKLRGEAFKLVNEDGLSAKWLNDFNIGLENFKLWVNQRGSRLGM